MINGFYKFSPLIMNQLRNKDKNKLYKDMIYYKSVTEMNDKEN